MDDNLLGQPTLSRAFWQTALNTNKRFSANSPRRMSSSSFLILLCCSLLSQAWLAGCLPVVSSTIPEQQFTFGIVLSNPSINDAKLLELIKEAQSSLPEDFENLTVTVNASYSRLHNLTNLPIRVQLNPVYTIGLGLDKIIHQLFCSPQSKGTNAIFFLVDQSTSASHNGLLLSNFMASLGGYAGLPSIAWTSSIIEMEAAKNEFSMLLLAPSVRSQARALFSFLRRFLANRKVSILISSKAKGYEHFLDELRLLSDQDEVGRRYSRFQFDSHQHHMSKRFVEVIQLENSTYDNIRRELAYLRDNTNSRVFLLYTDMPITDKIMEEAHLLGMTTSDFVWICGKPSYAEIIPPNYLSGMLVATYNTSISFQVLALKAGIRLWSEAVRRLVTTANLATENLMPTVSCTRFSTPKWKFGPLFYRLLRQRLIRMMYGHGDAYSALNDLSILSLGMNRQWKKVGEWQSKHGLQITDKHWAQMFGRVVRLGKTAPLQIVTLDEPPYVTYELPPPSGICPKNAVPCRLSSHSEHKPNIHTTPHQHSDEIYHFQYHRNNLTDVCCVGFVIDLLRKLSVDIGFQFEVFEVADRKWGAYNPLTGQWNGLVKAVLDGNADMVATSLKINTERNSAIDFSVPFCETGVTILVRLREGLVSPVAFLLPFSLETWLVVFLGFVNAYALFIFFYENSIKMFAPNNINDNSSDSVQNVTSLFGSFWLVLSMLFNAAMKTDTPKSISGRLVINVWAFFCAIFMSSFMANLAAFMITKEEFFDFSGLDDYRLKNPYTKNPPWKFSTIAHGATEQLIRTNNPEMYEYMRKFTKADVEEGANAVKSGELDAFVYDASVLSYKAGRDKNCLLRTVGKWYAPTGYGIGLPKSSKWLHLINKNILDYQVSGYLQQLEDYWLSSSCKDHVNKELGHRSTHLGITNFYSAFLLLAIGICACAIFLLLENLCLRTCRRRVRRVDKCDVCGTVVSPTLGKAFSLRKMVQNATRKSRDFSCKNPACRFRHRFLQQQVVRNKERIRELENQNKQIDSLKAIVESMREHALFSQAAGANHQSLGSCSPQQAQLGQFDSSSHTLSYSSYDVKIVDYETIQL